MFECLPFGFIGHGVLILLFPDVSPMFVAFIFREFGSWENVQETRCNNPEAMSSEDAVHRRRRKVRI